MIVELFRLTKTLNSTQGLLAIDGTSMFTTLEPAEPIPAATYHVIKEFSPRFQKLTPHLQDVPGHTYVEMHVGNFPKDTHLCILIGETRGVDYIGLSDMAFESLMSLLPEEFDLTIIEQETA